MNKNPLSLEKIATVRSEIRAAKKVGVESVVVNRDTVEALLDEAFSPLPSYWELTKRKLKRRRQRKALDALMALEEDAWEFIPAPPVLDPEPYVNYYDHNERSAYNHTLPGGLSTFKPRDRYEQDERKYTRPRGSEQQ